jgi:hypothetical protein
MRYALTVDDVPVGFADLVGAPRAVGALFTLPGFEACGLRASARQLGVALRLIEWERVTPRAAARALAGALARAAAFEARLGLVDERGAGVAVWRIVAVEFPGARAPVIIAALREQAAGRGAEPARWVAGPGDASRLAA